MKSARFLLFFGLFYNVPLLGQSDCIDHINHLISHIENDSTLFVRTIDDSGDVSFDGGFEILVYSTSHSVQKAVREVGLSFGRITWTVYFQSNKPFKIIETEEVFEWDETTSGWNYSSLKEVYKSELYLFNCSKMTEQKVVKGQRQMSEGESSLEVYQPFIQEVLEISK